MAQATSEVFISTCTTYPNSIISNINKLQHVVFLEEDMITDIVSNIRYCIHDPLNSAKHKYLNMSIKNWWLGMEQLNIEKPSNVVERFWHSNEVFVFFCIPMSLDEVYRVMWAVHKWKWRIMTGQSIFYKSSKRKTNQSLLTVNKHKQT